MSSTVGFKRILILKSELTLESELQDLNNVNRIRNNQRKSRARRKEYLEELKSKLRKYESMGVEASMEIQASARLVAEENKRLRALLQSRGVVSLEIDTAIEASNVGAQAPSRASILEAKLNTKKPCTGDVCKTGSNSRQSNTLSPFQSSTEPRGGICKRPLTLVPLMTTAIHPVSLLESPALENRLSSSSIATPAFSPMDPSSDLMDHYEKESPDLSSQTSPGNDTISCTFAVNVITSMRADVSAEDVKAELGCGKDVECKIDNSTFFTIMDRYTE
jgi:hypothetical protein